jgi:4-hydroxybenzoate polyprenyltransferase
MTDSATYATNEPPLFVDLDGTLIKTDMLVESLLVLLKARPWLFPLVFVWLLRGRAHLKAQLAARVDVPADGLVYDEKLLEYLRSQRDRGRRLILATASHEKFANAISEHVGVFEGVLASTETRNLKGGKKLEAILQHTSGDAFDYAGNERADLEIWRKARTPVVVRAPSSVLRVVKTFATADEQGEPRRGLSLKVLVKALRVHQWLKNVLVAVPMFAAHAMGERLALLHVAAAFVAYSLCASSVYMVNDLSDLRADRLHPRKRLRPFASGDLPLVHGLLLAPILLASAFSIAWLLLPPTFTLVLAGYYCASMSYNFVAKQRAVWDVILLAGLYVMRVFAGAAAVPVPLSFWLLAFSMFLFLSLALAKRYSEMLVQQGLGRTVAHGRGYSTDDMPLLQSMGLSSGYLAVLVFALYINSPEIHRLYPRPYMLWAICPLLLFWVSRVWLKTHRGEMHDDPVVFAARDATSLFIGFLAVGFLAIGTLAT